MSFWTSDSTTLIHTVLKKSVMLTSVACAIIGSPVVRAMLVHDLCKGAGTAHLCSTSCSIRAVRARLTCNDMSKCQLYTRTACLFKPQLYKLQHMGCQCTLSLRQQQAWCRSHGTIQATTRKHACVSPACSSYMICHSVLTQC